MRLVAVLRNPTSIARYLAGIGEPTELPAASAVSGQAPPAGPQWLVPLAPLQPHPLTWDKPLCASLDGFTLHAAT